MELSRPPPLLDQLPADFLLARRASAAELAITNRPFRGVIALLEDLDPEVVCVIDRRQPNGKRRSSRRRSLSMCSR